MYNFLRLAPWLFVCAPTAFAQDVSQAMRQWWVECDSREYCSADIDGLTKDYETLTMRIQRSGVANSPIQLELTPETLVNEGAALRFDIPGVIEGINRKAGKVTDNSLTLSEPIGSPLLQGIMKGETLFVTIDFQNARGSQVFDIPLAGAIDSLTIMDVVQHRLGRTDAIVARGSAPVDNPSDVFPKDGIGPEGSEPEYSGEADAIDVPVAEGANGSSVEVLYTPAELPAAVLELGRAEAECGDPTVALNEMGAIVHRDATGQTTFLVPCQIGQANVSYYVVVHDPDSGSDYAIQRFELPPAHNKPDRVTLMNPQWLAEQGRLVSTVYGDMNLNCGAYEVHDWIAEEQKFSLSVYRAKADCTGPHVEPQKFPLEWTRAEMGD
ncbi:DUF1176 domain-containing protein [Neptunicoccus cionae]|uniref:DUF1176 domain-containing protein n=1 Tax=Neptunicoccus cionae TaxID=2035344 RepID=A0A916QY25_9RHOB|nr:DUF1176 domain-containing protein [Amylibacter cionae]GGA19488.1 hypothetical protein GCM10011498_20470 [Amylibacter cionae]